MKTLRKLFYVTIAASLFVACDKKENKTEAGTEQKVEAGADTVAYKVDTAASSIKWLGKKIAGQHNGAIKVQSGDLKAAGASLLAGSITINMNSITNEDLTDKTYNAKLIGHLRDTSFFAISQFPTSTFVISSVKDGSDGKKIVTGNLTIKGITNEVSFPADVKVEGNKVTAKGKAIIDRSKFSVKYGSSTFYPNIGDKLVNNEFELDFNLVAIK